jgi:long-chain acyl-CoA synthetase
VGSVLDGLKVGSGERVALLAANSDTYAELYAGVPSSGRVVVPLNGRWAEPELAYALEDAEVTILITDQDPGELRNSVEQVLSLQEYEDHLSTSEPIEFAQMKEDDLAGLFYTGGTTGQSKGVMLSHRNLIANTLHSQITMPLDGEDTYLVVAPMFHAAGSNSVLQCLALGICQVVVPAFEPNLCLDLIEKHRCSATLAVPTMVAALIEAQVSNPRGAL